MKREEIILNHRIRRKRGKEEVKVWDSWELKVSCFFDSFISPRGAEMTQSMRKVEEENFL